MDEALHRSFGPTAVQNIDRGVDPDIDPNVDPSVLRRRPGSRRGFDRGWGSGGWWSGQGPVVLVVAVGGGVGAAARHGANLLWPTAVWAFPWTTLWINVVGCALIGVLMVLVSEVFSTHRLVRPFVGTGVLGGFTTFSSYAVDIQQRMQLGGSAGIGLVYLGLTVLLALVAVWLAAAVTRRLLFRKPGEQRGSSEGDGDDSAAR